MASPRWCVRAWAAIPYSGVIYVFRAKRADRVKLWLWDGTGLVLVAKRLEKAPPALAASPPKERRTASLVSPSVGTKPQDALSSSGTFHDRKSLGSVYTLQRKR